MNDQPTSGSRWERPDGQPSSDDTAPIVPRRHVTKARVRAGAAGAAILLVGGAGGFALAHAVSHEDQVGSVPGRGPGGASDHRGFRGPGDGANGPGSPASGTGSGTAEDDT